MKIFFVIPLFLAAALLSGCATNRSGSTAPTTPSAAAAPQQAAVAVPAASAKKLVLFLSGPASSTQAKDWASFKREWHDTFADHAKAAGVAFSMPDGEPRATGDVGTMLTVYVNDYRMVGIGSRIFLGVMTGNAYINARLAYGDLKTGKPFGTQNINTSSSAWDGVFGKMTPQQVDLIASGVFRDIQAAR
jgi:hypothetical protein